MELLWGLGIWEFGFDPDSFDVLSLLTSWFFAGVFIARGKEDALVTKNIVPGDSVYGEKRVSIEVRF